MEYFKVNYDLLSKLKQINFNWFIIMILILVSVLLYVGSTIKYDRCIDTVGYVSDEYLILKIDIELSDKLINGKYLKLNDHKYQYSIVSYGEYEIINNQIYQDVYITISDTLINNYVGNVSIYYESKNILKYIYELFK